MDQLSIQNFYRREVGNPSRDERLDDLSSSPTAGDGFTRAEVDAVIRPDGLPPWEPSTPYDEVDIESLRTGPGCVTVTGRVINFYRRLHSSRKGMPSCYYYLYVKDNTGTIAVRPCQMSLVIDGSSPGRSSFGKLVWSSLFCSVNSSPSLLIMSLPWTMPRLTGGTVSTSSISSLNVTAQITSSSIQRVATRVDAGCLRHTMKRNSNSPA